MGYGEVYNRGYGVAYHSVLEVKLYFANSSTPSEVLTYSLGDIDTHNFRSMLHAFYGDESIVRWELNAYCNQTKYLHCVGLVKLFKQ